MSSCSAQEWYEFLCHNDSPGILVEAAFNASLGFDPLCALQLESHVVVGLAAISARKQGRAHMF